MAQPLHILTDPQELFRACAERIAALAAESMARHGRFHLALAGGSTPAGVYRLLATKPFRDRIDWSGVELWFGDERCVPPDHADSNYRMARETLLDALELPPERVHRMAGEMAPEQAAAEYAEALRRNLPIDGGDYPRFDLVLLGLGPDGHVASLFPDTEILHRRREPAAAVFVPKLDAWRLSLTLPAINHAHHVLILVSGGKKADVVRHIHERPPGAAPLPAQRIHPVDGTVEWLLDRDAARLLDPEVRG